MRPYLSFVATFTALEILRSFLLKLVLPTVPQDVSNWMMKSVIYYSPYLMLLSPRLQLVCLGRGLVGYWKGYFNHKRCRRRERYIYIQT